MDKQDKQSDKADAAAKKTSHVENLKQQINKEKKHLNPQAKPAQAKQASAADKKSEEPVIDPKTKQLIEDLNNKLLRSVAELENYKKRAEQQISEIRKYALTDFAKHITESAENFYRIMDHAPEELINQDETLKKFYLERALLNLEKL